MRVILDQPLSFCQPGRRSNQEDARFPDADRPEGFAPAFVVCDGVGGMDKGEVASRTVADALGWYMQDFDFSSPFTGEDFSGALAQAYDSLHRSMNEDTREMATTMTFVCFHSGGAFCAHMGDSRIYHVRPGVGILYQSQDHSLVNALVHSGNLTPEEAIDHPQSNIITRCISYLPKGEEAPGATAIGISDIEPGDYFFMATDGVTHEVSDEMLYEILSMQIPDREKMARIASLSRGSSDNNTAYLIPVKDVEESEPMDDGAVACETGTNVRTTPLPTDEGKLADEVYPHAPSGNRFVNFFKNLFGF